MADVFHFLYHVVDKITVVAILEKAKPLDSSLLLWRVEEQWIVDWSVM